MNDKVSAFVRSVAEAIVNKAAEDGIYSSAVRFTGAPSRPYNFVWIIVQKSDVPVEGSDQKVSGFYARTNDIDLLVGIPPSFSEHASFENTAELVDKICTFVSERMAREVKLDVLLQTSFTGSGGMPNVVGDSDQGFEGLHEQESFPGI